MESSNQFLGTQPVGKLMGRYAVPCIISLLVGALYNIVDQIFIANASYLGSYGNAANTVVFPLTVVALAIAVMVGDGCCAFVSLCLGQGRQDTAKHSVGNAIEMSVAAGVVLTALYLLFQTPLIALFGGTVNEQTFACSQEYFFYITLGIPFYMFGQAMNPVIRADGNPRFAMGATLAGALVNIVLDPVFIFGCRWGMMGAAVATVLGQVLTAALSVWYILHMKTIRPGRQHFRPDRTVCAKTLGLGVTSFLSQISLVAAMAAINNMLRQYGAADPIFGQAEYAQIPMAVVGIVMKFFQIIISVVVGMAAGCIPIVGFNMGARHLDRVRGWAPWALCWRNSSPGSSFPSSAPPTRAATTPTLPSGPSGSISASSFWPASTRPASSFCRPWARRRNPRLFPWCGKWCSVWALRCCCPVSSGWTACSTPCRCRIC